MQHEGGYIDPHRLELARLSLGATVGTFAGIFGNPASVLCQLAHYTAPIIKFPERRSELAKLRAEIAEISRIISVRAVGT